MTGDEVGGPWNVTIAHEFGATLWTLNADFDGLPGVVYLPKARSPAPT